MSWRDWFTPSPQTRDLWQRFRSLKRAYVSLVLLVGLYGLSLFAELLMSNTPLYVRYDGKSYFTFLTHYSDTYFSEDTFTGNGKNTRPNFRKIAQSEAFTSNPDNTMIFPPIPYGPFESLGTDELNFQPEIKVDVKPQPRAGSLTIDQQFNVSRARHVGVFWGKDDTKMVGQSLSEVFAIPAELNDAIKARFDNQAVPRFSARVNMPGGQQLSVSLSTYRQRAAAPKTLRIKLLDVIAQKDTHTFYFDAEANLVRGDASAWFKLFDEATRKTLKTPIAQAFNDVVQPQTLRGSDGTASFLVNIEKQSVRFPMPPLAGHALGLDSTGRDVLVRTFYALRTSVTFGLVLVIFSMVIGILIGAIQGFFGGWIDMVAQRLTEIWESIPFLYVMILLGAVFGRSFLLLLVVYGIFNWIGMSYYMRAEFLKLRRQTFVEAARTLGIPTRAIMVRHILPNALVPVVTFFPFSLVSAIGSLTVLDFLGFGLPVPTPSWGELLSQAQEFPHAWWLILYPALALFLVMMLGVFIGEGVRTAFDPKSFSRIE